MNYDYLPEKSILRTLFSMLSADLNSNISQIKCLLSVLSSVKAIFPPCDFSAVILPLMKTRELLMMILM